MDDPDLRDEPEEVRRHLGHALERIVGMPRRREIVRIGNSSLTGAAALAADPGLMPELVRLSGLPKELPLAQLADFERRFVNALLLP